MELSDSAMPDQPPAEEAWNSELAEPCMGPSLEAQHSEHEKHGDRNSSRKEEGSETTQAV